MTDPESQACETWKLMLDILVSERSRLPVIAAELGLSEAQSRVLQLLDPQASRSMCHVAKALDCDPSNVTGIVDRLEARGLVERCADPADRRVKKLTLTQAGADQRARLMQRLSEPPAAIRALSPVDQKRLRAILRRARHQDADATS
jgi:MarR family transcriptional regulator, organic hydroperoxide resistance regulator